MASAYEESVPLFQQLAGGDPPHGDALHPLSAFATASRGPAVRAWHRNLPRREARCCAPCGSGGTASVPCSLWGQTQTGGESACCPQWRWRLDEVFVKINGEMHDLCRAVDHEGEVLKIFATKRWDRRAALAEWRELAASITPIPRLQETRSHWTGSTRRCGARGSDRPDRSSAASPSSPAQASSQASGQVVPTHR